MYNLIIDVPSQKAGTLVYHRLHRLKSTVQVERPVHYQYAGQRQNECQVLVTTSKTAAELDAWLYAASGLDYIGVCEQVV